MMLILELLNLIFAPLGLTGNTVVLWFLGFCMRRNVVSVYILNLAGADFLFLCCHITGSVNDFLHGFNFTAISIYKVLFPVMMCSYITGLSMLSAISAERCLSVLWPVWHRHHRPRHMSAVICALLWLLSLLLSILVHIYCYLPLRFYCFPCPTVSFITAAWLIFLFMALCGSSLALLLRMLCGSRRLPLTRLYVTLGVAVLVFLLCGLPLGVMSVGGDMIFYEIGIVKFLVLERTAYLLSSINSSANPIIYFFVGSFRQKRPQGQQRRSLKLVLQKALEDVGEGETSGERLPQQSAEMSESPAMF